MDKPTIDTYNALAKEYDDKTIDFWERLPRTFIDAFAERLTGRVLDVGSGPGRDALLLKEKGIEVICLDASTVMVEMSRARGFESLVADFITLPFPDESFDGVWAYTSLQHVPKSEVGHALAEIRRVLKPQGVFGLGLIEGEGEKYRENLVGEEKRWFSYYSPAEVESLFTEYGFMSEHFETFQPEGSRLYLNFISRKI